MKLKSLNELNALYSGQNVAPSLYTAACLIEKVFDDICTESGEGRIQDVPVGNEKLPTKLVVICKKLISIYEKNSGEFTRSADSLKEKIKDLEVKKDRLEQVSDSVDAELKQLDDVRTEYAAALARSNALPEDCDCDKLRRECEQLESRLESLKTAEQEGLFARREELRSQIDLLKEKNEEYYLEHIKPLEDEAAELQHTIDEKEAQLRKHEEEKDRLEEKSDGATLRIAEAMSKVSDAEVRLRDKNAELAEQGELLEKAEKEYKEADRLIADTQKGIEDIRKNKLPAAEKSYQSFLDTLNKRNEELEKWQGEIDKLEEDCKAAQKSLDEASQTRKEKQEHYDKLTQGVTDDNEAIERLKKNIQELEGRSDRVVRKKTLKQYQEQYDAELKEYNDDTEQLKEIKNKSAELEKKKTELDGIITDAVKKKKALESTESTLNYTLGKLEEDIGRQSEGITKKEEEIKALESELSAFSDENAQRKLNAANNRIQQLLRAKNSLKKAIDTMSSALNKDYVPRTAELYRIEDGINWLNAAAMELSNAFSSYARKEIKLEERSGDNG